MYYTENELAKLIDTVEKEFRADLVKAESEAAEPLAKSEDEKKDFKPEHEEESEPKEEHEEAPAEGEEHQEEAAPEGEEHQEAAPAMHQEGAEAGHDYDDEDLEHMHKMYMSMGKAELLAHHDAVRKCLDSQGGMSGGEVAPAPPHGAEGKEAPDSHSHPDVQKNEDGIESSEPHNALGPKSPASAANGEKINVGLKKNALGAKSPASDANGDKINVGLKKSDEERRGNGGKMSASPPPKSSPGAKSPASKVEGVQMGKSETDSEVQLLKSEFEAQKAKSETLQKTLDGVTEFLTKLAKKTSAPQGKAVTSYDVIAKSEDESGTTPMSKSEIVSILNKKASDPSLTKSDREAINNFYLSNASVNSISHLLK
jgi:hypothetical protein